MFLRVFIQLRKLIRILKVNVTFLDKMTPRKGKKHLKLYNENYIWNTIFIYIVYPSWKSGVLYH